MHDLVESLVGVVSSARTRGVLQEVRDLVAH
jgi:hypothetical protein